MLQFTVRRSMLAVPTLLFISLVIFLLLNLAPNDPMAQVPLTVPPEVKEKMREALGLGQPLYIQFAKWLMQFFWIEPQVLIDHIFGTTFSEGAHEERIEPAGISLLVQSVARRAGAVRASQSGLLGQMLPGTVGPQHQASAKPQQNY